MIARGEGQGEGDSISLDVHAIAELKEKGVPSTNDAFKYNYVADDRGCYSELERGAVSLCYCNSEYPYYICAYVRMYICISCILCAENPPPLYDIQNVLNGAGSTVLILCVYAHT